MVPSRRDLLIAPKKRNLPGNFSEMSYSNRDPAREKLELAAEMRSFDEQRTPKMPAMVNKFAQLVERIQAGDDAAMSVLMEKYSEPLRRAASQLIGKALRSQLDSVDLV